MYIHPASFFPDENYRIASDSCFVIMPFSEPWCTNVYHVIRELTTDRADLLRPGGQGRD